MANLFVKRERRYISVITCRQWQRLNYVTVKFTKKYRYAVYIPHCKCTKCNINSIKSIRLVSLIYLLHYAHQPLFCTLT